MTDANTPETPYERMARLHREANSTYRKRCQFAHLLAFEPDCENKVIPGSKLRVCSKHQKDLIRLMERHVKPGSPLIQRVVSRRTAPEPAEVAERIREKVDVETEILRLRRELGSLKAQIGSAKSKLDRKKSPQVGVVYFLKSNGFMKIGWTSDLDQRLKQYDPDARVLAVKPGTRKDETALHKKFADLKTHRREWFGITPRLMEEVERTVREHGEPPRELNEPVVTKRIVGPRDENYIGGKRKSA